MTHELKPVLQAQQKALSAWHNATASAYRNVEYIVGHTALSVSIATDLTTPIELTRRRYEIVAMRPRKSL